jgi:hypothetical protein
MSQSIEGLEDSSAVVAAERPPLYAVPDLPPEAYEDDEAAESELARHIDGRDQVFIAQETEQDELVSRRFERWYASAVGKTALRGAEVCAEPDSGSTNLSEQMREAAAGNKEALRLVTINVATAVSEVCFKDRHISQVYTELDECGELKQFGQSMRSVQYNSLQREGRNAILMGLTRQEALNSFRLESLAQSGLLKDYYFIEPSVIPDGLPERELDHRGEGFFTGSLTYIARATTMQEDGQVAIQSGFMAGVRPETDAMVPADMPEARFERRMQERHDMKALGRIYEAFGKEAPETAEQFLGTPLLIPKEMMPNGVADFMRLCDLATDDVLGRRGEERPVDEYISMFDQSKAREASLQTVIDDVVEDFLAYADTAKTEDPMESVQLMWQLIKQHTVDAAFENKHIDPRVFGAEAAEKIHQIRRLADQGEYELLAALKSDAHEKAVVTGCGGGASSQEGKEAGAGASGSETRSDWKLKTGVCRIPQCPTRPGETTLGPCGICMTSCQKAFDAGKNPMKAA